MDLDLCIRLNNKTIVKTKIFVLSLIAFRILPSPRRLSFNYWCVCLFTGLQTSTRFSLFIFVNVGPKADHVAARLNFGEYLDIEVNPGLFFKMTSQIGFFPTISLVFNPV